MELGSWTQLPPNANSFLKSVTFTPKQKRIHVEVLKHPHQRGFYMVSLVEGTVRRENFLLDSAKNFPFQLARTP